MPGWGTGGYVQRANPARGGYQDLAGTMYNNNVGVGPTGGLHIQPAGTTPTTPVAPPAITPGDQMNRSPTVMTPPAAEAASPPAAPAAPPTAPGAGAGTADQYTTPTNLLDPSNPWSKVYQSLSGSGIDQWKQYQPGAPTGEQNITQWMQGGTADPLFAAAAKARAFGNNNPYLAALIAKQGGIENANATINHYLAGGASGYVPDSPMAFGWKWDGSKWVPPEGDTSGLMWDPTKQQFTAGTGFDAFAGGLPAYGTPGATNPGAGGTPQNPLPPVGPGAISPVQKWLGNWWSQAGGSPVVDVTAPGVPAPLAPLTTGFEQKPVVKNG